MRYMPCDYSYAEKLAQIEFKAEFLMKIAGRQYYKKNEFDELNELFVFVEALKADEYVKDLVLQFQTKT